MPLVGRRIPRIGRCVGWEGGGMFCGVVGASGSIVEAGRAVRVGRAGRAVRGGVGGRMGVWCLCGAVCRVMMGLMPFFRGLGVRAGCAVGLFAVIVVVRHALLPS